MNQDLINEKFEALLSLKNYNNKTSESYFIKFYFIYYHCLKYKNYKLLEKLSKDSIAEINLDDFQFKKVKGKALIALKNWIDGTWEFVCLDYIPTPYEVLDYQARGVRPVTVILQQNFAPILNREDCLEFFLHDLEHGHMFFFNSELKNMQMRFFSNVAKTLGSGLWREYLKDEEFKKNFYYLISDMNTHEEHYKQFLKATLPSVSDFSKFENLFS